MTCHYCKQDPGLKPGSDTVWNGFFCADTRRHVCWLCHKRHYGSKPKSTRWHFSEFPVTLSTT